MMNRSTMLNFSLALEYTGRWCCDNCCDRDGAKFDIKYYTVGPHLAEQLLQPQPQEKPKRTSIRGRPTKDRPALIKLLQDWRKVVHSDDPVSSFFPIGFILEDWSINSLAKAPRRSVDSPAKITSLLGETEEWAETWAEGIYSLIAAYDSEIVALHN